LQKTSRRESRSEARSHAGIRAEPRRVGIRVIHAFEDLDSRVVSPPGIERASAGGAALEASTRDRRNGIGCTRVVTRRVHGIPSCSSASDKSHADEGGGGVVDVPPSSRRSMETRLRYCLKVTTSPSLFPGPTRISLSLSLSLSLSCARARPLVPRFL